MYNALQEKQPDLRTAIVLTRKFYNLEPITVDFVTNAAQDEANCLELAQFISSGTSDWSLPDVSH